jgi:membrane protease YdiL (CAAX protease family)
MRASEAAGLTVLTFGLLFGLHLGTAALRAAVSGGDLAAAKLAVSIDPASAALIQLAAFVPVLFLALRRRHGSARVGLRAHVGPASLSVIVLAVVAGAALQLPLAEIGNAVDSVLGRDVDALLLRRRLIEPQTAFEGVAVVLALVAVAPITEELLFRGAMLDGLRERYGTTAGVVLSSLLFAALHPSAGASSFVAGVLLGALAARRRSVVPSIVLHAACNAVPILIPERVLAIRGWNTVASYVEHIDARLVIATASLSLLALAALLGRRQPTR